ncbi:LysE family translocator [Roseobacter weihaiensis]|uniref:LysE family translocator n=1 Tax=Roseobacter weihaiensis TaxID=2763262 RepID=UPI0029CAB9E9|nr:LysE family transporter [Roseobacter sp. H9]
MKTEVSTFWQSVTVEILNPKTVIFGVAFLPQFAEPTATLPMWTQLMALRAMANLMFSIPDIACVLLSSRITKLFSHSKTSTRLAQKVGGSLLVGLGVKLAVS